MALEKVFRLVGKICDGLPVTQREYAALYDLVPRGIDPWSLRGKSRAEIERVYFEATGRTLGEAAKGTAMGDEGLRSHEDTEAWTQRSFPDPRKQRAIRLAITEVPQSETRGEAVVRRLMGRPKPTRVSGNYALVRKIRDQEGW